MLKNYLKLAMKVLARRKFFTFVSLFGITFTLVVLVLASALVDHAVAPFPPEVHQDRTVGTYFAMLSGEHMRRSGGAGFRLLDGYMRDIPGVERMSIVSYPSGTWSYLNGARVHSYLKRTDGEFWRIMRFDKLGRRLRWLSAVASVALVGGGGGYVAARTRRPRRRRGRRSPLRR